MRGIWPILCAYFGADGRLDREAMRRQVDTAVAWGAPGVAVRGVAVPGARPWRWAVAVGALAVVVAGAGLPVGRAARSGAPDG